MPEYAFQARRNLFEAQSGNGVDRDYRPRCLSEKLSKGSENTTVSSGRGSGGNQEHAVGSSLLSSRAYVSGDLKTATCLNRKVGAYFPHLPPRALAK